MATKTFCDICDEQIPPSTKKYRVAIGEVMHDEVCPQCYRSLTAHLEDLKTARPAAELVRP